MNKEERIEQLRKEIQAKKRELSALTRRHLDYSAFEDSKAFGEYDIWFNGDRLSLTIRDMAKAIASSYILDNGIVKKVAYNPIRVELITDEQHKIIKELYEEIEPAILKAIEKMLKEKYKEENNGAICD